MKCALCKEREADWTSPTRYQICNPCIIETLRADVAYWRERTYRLWDELEELAA